MKASPQIVSGIALGVLLAAGTGCWMSGSSPAVYASAPARLTLDTPIDLTAYRAGLPKFPSKNGHTRSRLAKGCFNCWTDVTIIASDTARFFGPNDPPRPSDSVAVAYIKNLGDSETVMYDLKPGSLADYVVYVINEAGTTKWILVEVPPGTTGTLKVRKKGDYSGCKHSPGKKNEADFRNCDYDSAGKGVMQLASAGGWHGLVAGFMKRAGVALEDPGWISCTDGCCILGMQ